jgi:hypothetical protein
MSDLVYPKAKGAILGASANGGPIDFDADPIYALLVTNTYVGTALATLKTHQFRSSITGESSGTGYTTGGVQLTSPTITQSGDNYIFDAADPSWASSSITARGVVLFKRVGADLTTPADDPLIALLDFGSDVVSTGGTFQAVFNASGILSLA